MWQLLVQVLDQAQLFQPDADCGRGFVRIENFCFNVSFVQMTPADVQTSCGQIKADAAAGNISSGIQALLKVRMFLIVVQQVSA